ncbi:MAG: hypothetical protein H8E62_02215 [Planctomycetes bacterium]|nr:hypothetical protein [Planctomycetota bacterium]
MKKTRYFVVVCLLMVSGMLNADLPTVPIASGSGLASPDIDGGLVAWQGGSFSTGTDIYWKTFADPNDPNTVSITGDQILPAVNGNIVVWEDRRNGLSDPDIYWQDVLLHDDPTYPMGLTVTDRQKAPAISGNIMVWHDRRNGNYDIYGYDLSGVHLEICTDLASQYEAAVSGNIVVWRDGRDDGYAGNDIYMADISGSAPYSSVAVAPNSADQYRPAIDGNIIVWEEIGVGTVSLVAYDIVQGQVVWTRTQSVSMLNLDISGNIIVWQEGTTGDYDILGWDLSSGALLEIASTVSNETVPAISGRRVVWQRNDTDIVGAEIPTPTQIAVLSPNGGEMFLAGSEMLIEWDMVDGTDPVQIDIEYSIDNGNSFNQVASDITFDDFEYLWKPIVDVVDSQQCLIRISDAEDGTVSDITDGAFTVFLCDTSLTADLSGDCFVGMEDFAEIAGQWLACGNPYNSSWCVQ